MSAPKSLGTLILGLVLAAVFSVAGCILAWVFSGAVPWLRYVAWVLTVPASIVALLVLLFFFERKIYGLIAAVRYILGPKEDYVRQATPDDAEAIAALESQAAGLVGGRGSGVTGNANKRTAWWHEFLAIAPTMNYHDGRTQVAFVTHYGVGVKAFVAIQFHPVGTELVALYCDPDWYPRENYRALMLHAFDRMRNNSRHSLWAKVRRDDPLRKEYTKFGAAPVAADPERMEWREIDPRYRLKR